MKRTKYIIMAVFNGVTKEFRFTVEQKEEAKATYKNILLRADRAKVYSIDSEDEDIWYDQSEKWA